MSQKLLKLLERLAEMFPKQDYQTRLEQYLADKQISNVAEAEYWVRKYDQTAAR